MTDTEIGWLVSYPKSGSTWVRIFIATFLDTTTAEQLDLNKVSVGAISSDRQWLEGILGFDISDLHPDEIDLLRPDIYRWVAEHADRPFFVKAHDCQRRLPNGKELVPASAIGKLVHIVRNPLDVCVSMAAHFEWPLEDCITAINNPEFALLETNSQIFEQVRQMIGSWSSHADSWLGMNTSNKLLLRYEDLCNTPHDSFSILIDFLGLDIPANKISRTINATKFEVLQRLEHETGFREASSPDVPFFRSGSVGDWQSALTPPQVTRILSKHGTMMQQLGYLDNNNQLTDLVYPR